MKVGKEGIAGLIGALETYRLRNGPEKRTRNKAIIEHLYALLDGEPGLKLQIIERPGNSPNTCALRITVESWTCRPGCLGIG